MRRTVSLWVVLLGLAGTACGADDAIEARGPEPTPLTASADSDAAGIDPDGTSPEPAQQQSLTDTVRDVEDLPSPPWYEGSGIEGLWILTSGTFAGEVVAEGLFLEIDTKFASGDSTCNSFSFDRLTRSGSMTVAGCSAEPGEPDRDLIEEAILGVIQNGPVLEGDALVFKAGEVELIYQRARD